jgi:folylpolyglutamate synthase/dihydropteroate synthase
MIELGLQRISRLLSKTHLPWRAIHVAGTNGKGSICVYISGMLEAYNDSPLRLAKKQPRIRHGRFTSPHLIDRWDCISINQKPVSSALFHEIEKKVLLRNAREEINASEFELLTATAFEIFTHEKVDIGVIEVGMGGRLDATNILGQPVQSESPSTDEESITRALPLVTAIAKIGLDHQTFLGSTLQAIAAEKAGILKPGVPLVYDSSNPPEVTSTFQTLASQIGAPISNLMSLLTTTTQDSSAQQSIAQTLPLPDLQSLGLAPEGSTPAHTRQNTSVALQATLIALNQFIPSTPSNQTQNNDLLPTLLSIPSQTTFPGRLQPLSIHPLTRRKAPILLDGAHNAQSAAVLAEAVARLRNETSPANATATRKVTWLLAASDSKNIEELLAPLLKPGDAFCAVEFGPVDGMPWVRAMGSEKVGAAARAVLGRGSKSGGDEDVAEWAFGRDVVGGLKRASEIADEGPLVVAGSLYLVGSVLRALRESQEGI